MSFTKGLFSKCDEIKIRILKYKIRGMIPSKVMTLGIWVILELTDPRRS